MENFPETVEYVKVLRKLMMKYSRETGSYVWYFAED